MYQNQIKDEQLRIWKYFILQKTNPNVIKVIGVGGE
jgi:hypothetical protein